MTFQKSLKEKQRALNAIHAASGWYALLLVDNPTTVNITSVEYEIDYITAIGHDFIDGCRVFLSNVGGSLPGGLVGNTEYRVIGADGNGLQLCTEANYNPETKTGTPIEITSAGSGVTTITEQPLSTVDDFDVLARKEVPNYYGTSRQAISIPSAVINYNQKQVTIGPINISFVPTTGSITYRYFVIIEIGEGSENLVGFEDYIFTQTIDSTGKIFQYSAVL